MNINFVAETIRAGLDDKTAARDKALAHSRSAIRLCGKSIRALHRSEVDVARGLLAEARSEIADGRDELERHPDMLHTGFVHDAEKEVAEAAITIELVTGAEIPSPESLGVQPSAWLKGMAEAIGELRRHILDLMRAGDLQRCEEMLAAMDEMYHVLVTMDYPDGITFGLRRLTDVARSIIERTRGDFTVAVVQASLREAIEASQKLDLTDGS